MARTARKSNRASFEIPETIRSPHEERIARRAYELYEARGRGPGYDLDDWLQAERELRPVGPLRQRTAIRNRGSAILWATI
jgi:hypothetical protein